VVARQQGKRIYDKATLESQSARRSRSSCASGGGSGGRASRASGGERGGRRREGEAGKGRFEGGSCGARGASAQSGRARGRAEGRTGLEGGASPEAGLIGEGGRRRGRPGVGGVACRERAPDQHGDLHPRDAGEGGRTLMLAWSFSRNVCCAVTAVESPFFGVSGCGREGSVSALALPDGRHSRGSEGKEGTYRSAEPVLEPLPLLYRDGVEPLGHEDEQVVLDEGHRGAERDAALGVGARERVVRDEERELVRGDEGGDRGEEAREGEVVCAAGRSISARP